MFLTDQIQMLFLFKITRLLFDSRLNINITTLPNVNKPINTNINQYFMVNYKNKGTNQEPLHLSWVVRFSEWNEQ